MGKDLKGRDLGRGFAQRPDGRFYGRVTIQGKAYGVYADTLRECRSKLNQLKVDVENGSFIETSRLTFLQFAQEVMEQRRGKVKACTLRQDGVRLARCKPIYNTRITEIDTRQVQRVVDEVAKNVSAYAANATLDYMAKVFRIAVKMDIRAKNPCDAVGHFKTRTDARETNHRALTREETRVFLEHAKESSCYNLYEVMLTTGMRCGEVCALRMGDIDFKRGVIHVSRTLTQTEKGRYIVGETPKTDAGSRTIPIQDVTKQALRRQMEQTRQLLGGKVWNVDQLIFIGPVKCGPLACNVINANIQSIVQAVNDDGFHMEPFTSHAFRDTFATRCIEDGMNPNTLKAILGHSSLAMTMDLYAHVLEDTKAAEVAKVDFAV